ncbi:MAG: sensor histidine kinase [Desulfuromonadaceae bacterium]|nr:sensor histidine kinase [Desulfuromonadaceae bacterium]MDD2847258.1 sensor histidine kinase [Desulfuromonadaceae bacterium]MDD4130202.1 sensor histidine kinase [Desulfuromonadaceae bacterium]
MDSDGNRGVSAASRLRGRAEEQLIAEFSEVGLCRTGDEPERLLHELNVHRIELEMQNAELRQTRDEAELSLEKYTDLYDFAPVGYLTLDRNGDISAINLSGASLLGVERPRLIGCRFGLWVTEKYRLTFSDFLDKVYTSLGKVVCEVQLCREGLRPLFVQVEAMDNVSGQECRLALIDITGRKKAEDELRSYACRLIEMEEDLRKKLASELHDEIGRDLTVLGMNLAIISSGMTDDAPKNLTARVTDSSRLIEGISRTVRGIMFMLRPPVLDDYGLLAALRWHADLFEKRTGIAIIVRSDDPIPRVTAEKEMALFRIAQEAVMNASKHAATMEVTISISRDNGMLRFMISDDGRGFTPASFEHIQGGSGWGIKIMRERAELIGGNFQVDSAPGKGTVVSVSLPLEER